jgi:dipeptidyl aminopeptidase/acylaminoacyl peptidase
MDTRARRSMWAGPGLLFAAWCSLFAAAEPAPGTSAPALDPLVEAYGALPAITDLQISPDGKRIAAMRPLGGVQGLTVIDMETRTQNVALAADPARFQISYCRWANEERLVCQVRSAATFPRGGTPIRFMATQLIAVNHDGSQSRTLLDDRRARLRDRVQSGSYISLLPDDREHILVPLVDEQRMEEIESALLLQDTTIWPEVWKLNIYNDTRTRAVRSRDGIGWWIATPEGDVRVGISGDPRSSRAIVRQGDDWKPIEQGSYSQELDAEPLHLSSDGTRMLIAARAGADRRAVHEVDTATGAITRTLWQDPRFDFDGGRFIVGGELQGLLTEDDQLRLIPLTDDWKALERELAAALPGESLVPWSTDRTGSRLTLRSTAPHRPTVWYFYDRTARKLTRIGPEYPRLRDAVGTSARWVSYRARDGLEIPALLTLPSPSARGLPTIVMPHGGPVSRDTGRFDFIAAFLAARGYAVLQPQFRGSFGYGGKHLEAGFGQWGLAMQDDVIDGLDWLRKEGIADPERACVVGLSYGGYSALVAAYKTPGKIRCVASYAGVADLPMLIRNRTLYRIDVRTMRYLQLSLKGDVLDANSPALNAAQFGVPALIMHADLDTNVLVEQSRDLVDALKAAGKPHRYIEQSNGDHFLGVQAHRTQWLQELDAFLREHLAQPSSGAGADAGAGAG